MKLDGQFLPIAKNVANATSDFAATVTGQRVCHTAYAESDGNATVTCDTAKTPVYLIVAKNIPGLDTSGITAPSVEIFHKCADSNNITDYQMEQVGNTSIPAGYGAIWTPLQCGSNGSVTLYSNVPDNMPPTAGGNNKVPSGLGNRISSTLVCPGDIKPGAPEWYTDWCFGGLPSMAKRCLR